MNLVIDLSNITRVPDVQEFMGFTPWSIVYMHVHFWVFTPLSVIGNLIVITTSLKYDSLKMDKISSMLLEHLAAADIILAVVGCLPRYVTFTAKNWVLGKAACILTLYFRNVGGSSEILILASISLYRAVMLKNPFLLRSISTTKLKIAVSSIWFFSQIPAIISYATSSVVYYEPKKLACTSSAYTETSSFSLVVVGLVILLGGPMICIIGSNISILAASIRYKYKRKAARMMNCSTVDDSNMKAITTVSIVCLVFLFSWTPFVVRVIAEGLKFALPSWFFVFQAHFLLLSVAFNPIIYTVTNRSFRDILRTKVFGVILNRT